MILKFFFFFVLSISGKRYYYKKYKKLKKQYEKERRLNPMIALQIQQIGYNENHEFLDFKTLGGGYMNLVMPRDPATIVMNQLPARVFKMNRD